MSSESNHDRRSEWRTVQRCMALLQLLMRGPCTTDDMLSLMRHHADEDGDSPTDDALRKRLEKDKARLQQFFQCEWDYDRASGTYTLLTLATPLIDLSPFALRGLAFLDAAFGPLNTPMRHEVQQLLDLVRLTMPQKRLKELRQAQTLLAVNLAPRDDDPIDDQVRATVEQACREHRLLEFDNLSPGQADGIPRHHTVEPHRLYLERGHYYLEAYRLRVTGPFGVWDKQERSVYRLGRIRNARLLPTKFVPRQRLTVAVELRYWLAPEVARTGGVTRYFANSSIIYEEDGAATVTAESHDLFTDLRTLLHYGPNCKVLGGDEAVKQMRALVQGMTSLYQEVSRNS